MLSLAFLFVIALTVGSQQQDGSEVAAMSSEMETRISLARAAGDYPVTPGDVYRLSFQRSTEQQTVSVPVASDYTVSLGFFGAIDAQGLTFPELETQVRSVVSAAYPNSFPRLDITAVATFEVLLTGEVKETGFETVPGPRRLSQMLRNQTTSYSSTRNVEIFRASGERITVDLFAARRDGDVENNPYLQPGDRILVPTVDRKVSIRGEVVRPGEYQLLDGEDLEELIQRYGGGLTQTANLEDVRVVTYLEDKDTPAEVRYFSFSRTAIPNIGLKNADIVTIGRTTDNLPVVFFEGAVQTSFATDDDGIQASGSLADQLRYQFTPGETLQRAVRQVRRNFLTTADLASAFLIREEGGGRIPIDLSSFLYSEEVIGDVLLHRNDRIIVPFRQYFVTVSGAVSSPGQYPYIPDRTYGYYLGLAGGTNPQRHIGEWPRVRNVEGQRKRSSAVIEPEDNIFFASTNPIYHLSPILGVASTVLSTIAIYLTITR